MPMKRKIFLDFLWLIVSTFRKSKKGTMSEREREREGEREKIRLFAALSGLGMTKQWVRRLGTSLRSVT